MKEGGRRERQREGEKGGEEKEEGGWRGRKEEEKEYRKPLTGPDFQLLCLKPVQLRERSLTILSRWL